LLLVKAEVAEVSEMYASAAVFIAASSKFAANTFSEIMNPETFGMKAAAGMPKMAMPINASPSVLNNKNINRNLPFFY